MYFEDLGSTLPPWILTPMRTAVVTVLLLFLSAPAEGQSQVIGSPQPILAAPGDDVILPCHLDPPFNVQGLTVEWSRLDFKPGPSDQPSRVKYVHLYRDRREVVDMKILSYFGRTQLFTDDLKQGNISLKIINVTLTDSGRYRCFIPKLRSNVKHSVIELVVDPNLLKTSTTEMPQHPTNHNNSDSDDKTDVKVQPRLSLWIPVIVFSVLLIMCVGLGGYLYKRKQEVHEHKTAPSEQRLV